MSSGYTEDDVYLNSLLQVATDITGNYLDNHVALSVMESRVKDFSGTVIIIPEGNFHDITSIIYTDRYKVSHTLSGSGYNTTADDFSFKIELDQWIDATDLIINYRCGFDAATIRPVIKQAILIKITDLYDIERASYHSGSFQLNKAFENLLNYHKRINIY